jgi:CheY-like chemotaxis protein
VVVTDQAMPGMSGLELVQALRPGGVAPPLVVMLSRFAESLAGPDLRPPGVDRVLAKPITLASLREALQAVDA